MSIVLHTKFLTLNRASVHAWSQCGGLKKIQICSLKGRRELSDINQQRDIHNIL